MAPLKQAQTSVLAAGASARAWAPCVLTWYDPALGGTNSGTGAANPSAHTASGEPYDPTASTCAAPPQYSYGTMITFRYGGNTVTCRVNDRGGAIVGNRFDLSRAAASTLGIMGAGRVAASFAVGGNASSGTGGQTGGGPGGDSLGIGSVISILSDLVTLNLSDAAARLALVSVGVVKDVAIGIGDFVIVPFWHWNQRAVTYYQQNILFGSDPIPQMWTAAFWGLGYWLLWTAPDGNNKLKPAAVRNSRMARHVRGLQGLPARSSLIKPAQVNERTPTKPKPTLSRVAVRQVGTLQTERPQRVRVRGNIDGTGNITESVNRTGTLSADESRRRREGEASSANAPGGLSDARNRAGDRSLPSGGGGTQGATEQSPGSRITARYRRTPRGSN